MRGLPGGQGRGTRGPSALQMRFQLSQRHGLWDLRGSMPEPGSWAPQRVLSAPPVIQPLPAGHLGDMAVPFPSSQHLIQHRVLSPPGSCVPVPGPMAPPTHAWTVVRATQPVIPTFLLPPPVCHPCFSQRAISAFDIHVSSPISA